MEIQNLLIQILLGETRSDNSFTFYSPIFSRLLCIPLFLFIIPLCHHLLAFPKLGVFDKPLNVRTNIQPVSTLTPIKSKRKGGGGTHPERPFD